MWIWVRDQRQAILAWRRFRRGAVLGDAWSVLCRHVTNNYSHRGVLATDDPAWWGSKKRHRNWRRSHVLVLDSFRNGNLRLECILIWKWSVASLWLLVTLGGVLVLQQPSFCVVLLCEIWFCHLQNFQIDWYSMFWSKCFSRIQNRCPFFVLYMTVKSYPLSSFATPWLLTQLRVCKQSLIQSIWHVLLPMRLGYLAGLHCLQLCWNEIMNSVTLKCQTRIKIALKCICDHCEFEAVDTFERLSSLYMHDQNSNLNVRTCYNSCGAFCIYARMQANYRYFHIMMSGPTGTPYEGAVTSPSLSDANSAVHVTWHWFFIHPAASQC